MTIDLHIHSCYSNDGQITPMELINKCVNSGIKIMSITDHNCVRANRDAQTAAKERGIFYIPGIEIDCVYQGNNFHMLGYGIDYEAADFEAVENYIRRQCFNASLQALEKTQELGFHVTENDMWNLSKNGYWSETWTGEMFAEVLLSKPEYKNHPLLQPYNIGGSRSDNPYVNFYWDFYAQGKPCYVEIRYPKMDEIVDLIHQNKGVAVLAHPGVNLEGKHNLLDGIVKLGIDGLEVFSSYHSPAQLCNFYDDVKRYHLFATCGSDFHGKTKPSIKIGQHGCLLSEQEMRKQVEKILTFTQFT